MMHVFRFPMKQAIVAAVLMTVGAITVVGCKRDQAAQHSGPAGGGAKAFAAPVTVAAAVSRDVPVYLDEIGRAAARESVNLVPQVAGRVTAVHFTEGRDVKKGDLLFEIDPRVFEAALAQAEAVLAQNKATLNWAQTQWKNVEGLQNAVSKEEFEQRRTAAETAEAQVKNAEAQVAMARLNMEYCKVVSPIDGRTGQVLIDPGNVVKVNEGTLVSIQKLDPIYVDFTATERELAEIRQNMQQGTLKVQATIPGDIAGAAPSAAPAAAPATAPAANAQSNGPSSAEPRTGELTFLDNSVQNNTGTIKLRATFANPDRHFWPGQFVNVRLVLATKKDAILIPTAAQQIGQQGPFVYVVKSAEVADPKTGEKNNATVAEMRLIKPGQRQGDMVVVDSGVQAGE